MARWNVNRRDLLKWAAGSSLATVPTREVVAQSSDADLASLRENLGGLVVGQEDSGFLALREAMAWNGRAQHARVPGAIVQAASVDDVSAAVKFARGRNWKVAVRGGGHNYHGAAVRDGGLLVDVSHLNRIEFDASTRRGSVQAGRKGGELATYLANLGYAFPVGHCSEVPLSGYLVSGGLGWNIGTWGPACASIRSIEMVTADGAVVHADAGRNADLFWAARGAGPGFFAIVTSFELEVYELPRAIRIYAASFDMSSVPMIATWLDDLITRVHPSVEVIASCGRDPGGQVIASVAAFVFAENEAVAQERVAPFRGRPIELAALGEPLDVPFALPELLGLTDLGFPKYKRMTGDMRWSNARIGTLFSSLYPLAASAPPSPSAIVVVSFGGRKPPNFIDAALSVGAAGFVGAYGFWDLAAEDAEHKAWVGSVINAVERTRTAATSARRI